MSTAFTPEMGAGGSFPDLSGDTRSSPKCLAGASGRGHLETGETIIPTEREHLREEGKLPHHLGAFARALVRERRRRGAFLNSDLLGEPAWELLLDLYAAAAEGKLVCATSACIASGAPATTALRYIGLLEGAGLLCRKRSVADRRMSYVTLSASGFTRMTELLTAMLAERVHPNTGG